MRFPYYRRLSRTDQATYRASDAVISIALPDPVALVALLPAVEAGLLADDRGATSRATRRLCTALCEQLGVPPLIVRVLARRPTQAASELHGLYEREPECVPILRVWMRTAAHLRPVAFRTFVRTVLHELCHHFDFELHGLRDTFHTEGFFRRESSLARALLGTSPRRRRDDAALEGAEPPSSRRGRAGRPAQLGLFDDPA
ncbi:MAG: hypothetical protein JNK45_18165 [Myxococcales bacterium]|nr:hypothetical protein [Myxococcales bacterium]